MTQPDAAPASPEAARPLIFLAGPPGSGKSSLGSLACGRLRLEFCDLSRREGSTGDAEASRADLEALVANRAADVVALSWSLQQEPAVLAFARRAGPLLLLWAHPLDMQARSGRGESLFTPVARLRTRGGFGRNGAGCREFRRLDRACTDTLLLVGASFEEAAEALEEALVEMRREAQAGPHGQEGLGDWVESWVSDAGAKRKAARVVADAMARYLRHLRSEGKSSRTLSGIRSDLDSAGMLVFVYDAPKVDGALDRFAHVPLPLEFESRIASSPAMLVRYRRSLEGFARFLRRSGMIAEVSAPVTEDEDGG